MAQIRRKGYTLIEMVVVTVLLSLFAALIVPNYLTVLDTQKRRAFFTRVVDLAGTARELAVSRSAIMYIQGDSTGNKFVVKQEHNDTGFQAADGATSTSASTTNAYGQTEDTNSQSNIGTMANDRGQDTIEASTDLPPGVQFGNFQLGGQSSDASSWKIRFYPDGSSDTGAVEFNSRGAVKSLIVTNLGKASLIDGTIPDTSQDRWQAGNYVQRQQ